MNQVVQQLGQNLLVAGAGNPLRGDNAVGLVLASNLGEAGLHVVWGLGLQPGQTEFGPALTPAVGQAVHWPRCRLGESAPRIPEAVGDLIPEEAQHGCRASA